MRFLNIWQGFRLSTMSPWYHLAFTLAGLCVDTTDTKALEIQGTTFLTKKLEI